MEKRSLKIFIACALGAGIGSLIALEMQSYFWWIGLLVGGFTGYISYDFKKVVKTIPMAYEKAKTWKQEKPSWQSRRRWVLVKQYMLVALNFFFSCLILMLLMGLFWEINLYSVYGDIRSSLIVAGIVFVVLAGGMNTEKENKKTEDSRVKDLKKTMNPFRIYLYHLPKGVFNFLLVLLKGIAWCLKKSPGGLLSGLRFISRFLKAFFILIHSDIRLLCGIDAMLGAGIGYFSGNIMMGIIIGGLLGVVNYELVSKRILKLVHY